MRSRDIRRIAASASVSLTGVALGGIVLQHLTAGPAGGGVAGGVLAAFGSLLAVGFLAGGYALYRSTIQTRYVLRVAGWNLLGVVATVAVLVAIWLYQQVTGGVVAAPLFSTAIVVGVSSAAHVLIGVNDVRRIRAEELAAQHKQTAVVNRFVRHNLKHAAQMLLAWGDQLTANAADETSADIGESLQEMGAELSDVNDQVKSITRLTESASVVREAVGLDSVLGPAVSAVEAAHPDADVSVVGDDSVTVLAGDRLETAFQEVLENGVEHGGGDVTVEIETAASTDEVTVTVTDRGPGFPELQRELVHENRAESPLEHGNGLGLWLARWITESYGGTLRLPETPDGATVEFTLDGRR